MWRHKEYKVGHGARKCDHFARAVFVSIVEGWIDDQQWEDQWLIVNTLCRWLIGGINDRHWEDPWSTVNTLCQSIIDLGRIDDRHSPRPPPPDQSSTKCWLSIISVSIVDPPPPPPIGLCCPTICVRSTGMYLYYYRLQGWAPCQKSEHFFGWSLFLGRREMTFHKPYLRLLILGGGTLVLTDYNSVCQKEELGPLEGGAPWIRQWKCLLTCTEIPKRQQGCYIQRGS